MLPNKYSIELTFHFATKTKVNRF